jgi:hypothetical protein
VALFSPTLSPFTRSVEGTTQAPRVSRSVVVPHLSSQLRRTVDDVGRKRHEQNGKDLRVCQCLASCGTPQSARTAPTVAKIMTHTFGPMMAACFFVEWREESADLG